MGVIIYYKDEFDRVRIEKTDEFQTIDECVDCLHLEKGLYLIKPPLTWINLYRIVKVSLWQKKEVKRKNGRPSKI